MRNEFSRRMHAAARTHKKKRKKERKKRLAALATGLTAVLFPCWNLQVQVGLLALLLLSQGDFLLGSFLPAEEEAKFGFTGYNCECRRSCQMAFFTFTEKAKKRRIPTFESR